MPEQPAITKARLIELKPGGVQGREVKVQFNPQTLKLSYSNQSAGGSQPQGSSTAFTGQGSTKLTMELWFDATLPAPEGLNSGGDVRNLTKEIAAFLKPVPPPSQDKKETPPAPPNLRFLWGSFLFDGVLDSMDETIELFAEQGVPLRAVVSISLSKQDLKYQFEEAQKTPPGPGTEPRRLSRLGESLQQIASRAGVADWRRVALDNGIENPRQVPPGLLLKI